MAARLDMRDNRFGRWTVFWYVYTRAKRPYWRCRCDCGKWGLIPGGRLRCGKTRSCGCWNREKLVESNTTHGMSRLPEYNCWKGIISRCTNPKNRNYKYYGARGISVSDRWRYGEDGKSGVMCFLEDILTSIGRRPGKGYSIDRIDNNGNYEPSNLKWSTWSEQLRNRRPMCAEVLAAQAEGRRRHYQTFGYRTSETERACKQRYVMRQRLRMQTGS
jgi:hypothetical protein